VVKKETVMKHIFILILILFLYIESFSAFEDTDNGARSIGMGSAFVGLANDSYGIFYNPAGIRTFDNRDVSLFYSRPFGLKELSYVTVTFVQPFKFFNLGTSIKTYGFELYRENIFILSFAKNYEEIFYYGFNVKYFDLNIKNYGSDGTLGLDSGFLVKFSPEIQFGFCYQNFNSPSISKAKEKLPQIFSFGLSLLAIKDLVLNIDAYKDVKFPLTLKLGMEYKILNTLYLRAGFNDNPSKFATGIGIEYKILRFDYSIYTHQDLGYTHQASITFLKW
jgi:hypothetical protein